MALAWNEIKDRALAFSKEWAKAESEDAEAKHFWIEFFNAIGVSPKRIGGFEQRVKKLDGKDGYIDWLWKGNLLIKHKSRGKNLSHLPASDRLFPRPERTRTAALRAGVRLRALPTI